MWHTLRAAGRPWPKLDPDPVIDYMIMEAIHIKIGREQQEAEKAAKLEAWRSDRDHLKQHQ
jgi:hypothetical protein